MIIQELNDVHFEFPTGDDPPARQGVINRPAVAEGNFTPQLDTVNNHVIKNLDHWLIVTHSH